MTCPDCNDTGIIVTNRNPLGFHPGEHEVDCPRCARNRKRFFELLWDERRRRQYEKTHTKAHSPNLEP